MSLTVTVNMPSAVEVRVLAGNPNWDAYAREAIAVQLFRDGKINHCDLGQTLGLDRTETDAVLKRHHVHEFSLTHADIDAEFTGLNELLGRVH